MVVYVRTRGRLAIATVWFILAGVLFIAMALGGSVLKRLPLTTSVLYLAVGFGLGPHGADLLDLDPLRDARLLEHVTEVAVLISLFTAGLNMRVGFRVRRWLVPLRLAFGSMAITVGMIAAVGWAVVGLSLGAAILLGAILAPTDPVLASEVQLNDPMDRDTLRFSLTGEAGFNDGTAFPFVMLGLGIMGAHELGVGGVRWIAVDVVWAIAGGLAIGAALGLAVAWAVIHLRQTYGEAVGLEEFLTLGLVALAYGAALLLHTYGFLAVFAAGLALRSVERRNTGQEGEPALERVVRGGDEVATHPETASMHMAQAILGFNEQLGRIGEVVIVVMVGSLLGTPHLTWHALWFVPLLLLVIRPVSAAVGLHGAQVVRPQRMLIAWFGIRGIGSIFYMAYALEHGLEGTAADEIVALTLATIAMSVVVHGVSVTPLMQRYDRRIETGRSGQAGVPETASAVR
jgi:NhaP-type Na+/H+ or K+/H+ antiporter